MSPTSKISNALTPVFRKVKSLGLNDERLMREYYKKIQEAEYEFNNDRVTSDENISKQIDILKESLAESGFELFLISFDGMDVGFLELQDEYNLEAGYNYTYIHNLLIRKEYRGKGYGKIAVNFAKKIAKLKGHKHIGLTVLTNNIPALNLHKSQGFSEYGIEMMEEVE